MSANRQRKIVTEVGQAGIVAFTLAVQSKINHQHLECAMLLMQ